MHCFCRICAYFVGSIKSALCLNGQPISHPFLSNKSYSTIFRERMRLCVAVQFQNFTHRRLSQHSSWLPLQTRNEVTEKILRNREDVQTLAIEVTTSSSAVGDEDQLFFRHADCENRTGAETLEQKDQSRKKATERVTNEQPSSRKPISKEFAKISGNTTSYSMNRIKAKAGIRVKYHVDPGLQKL